MASTTDSAMILTPTEHAQLHGIVYADVACLLDGNGLVNPPRHVPEYRERISVLNDLTHVLDTLGWDEPSLSMEMEHPLPLTTSAFRALEFCREEKRSERDARRRRHPTADRHRVPNPLDLTGRLLMELITNGPDEFLSIRRQR